MPLMPLGFGFFFTSVLFRSGHLFGAFLQKKIQDHTIQPRIHDLFPKSLGTLKTFDFVTHFKWILIGILEILLSWPRLGNFFRTEVFSPQTFPQWSLQFTCFPSIQAGVMKYDANPNHATIVRKILQIYHTFGSFDSTRTRVESTDSCVMSTPSYVWWLSHSWNLALVLSTPTGNRLPWWHKRCSMFIVNSTRAESEVK